MPRIILLALIIYSLVLAGIATRQGGFLGLAIPVMIYLALSLFYEPETPRLEVSRALSHDRANPGQPVTISLTLTNQGEQLEEVLIEDIIPPGLMILEGTANLLTVFQPGQTVTLTYTVAGPRGLYRFSTVQATARETLALFEKKVAFDTPAQLFVLPEIVKVRQVAIRPRRVGVYNGLVPARQGGPGIEFFGVREYQPGDPMRWVNARASARYDQTLFINEFEQERMVDIGLILDARQQSDVRIGSETLFEYTIQAAATLTETFLGSGNRVGLLIYGRSLDWTLPGYGKIQQERILRALARAEQGEGRIFENFEYLPTRLFPAHSQLVLMSPLLRQDPEMLIKLRATGYQLLIISPDPISFEQQKFAMNNNAALAVQIARIERALILRQLTHAGIQVVDWPVDLPFHQVAHIALSRLAIYQGRTLF